MEIITPLDGPLFLTDGHCFLNFCGDDPFQLANHPDLKKNSIRYILQYGISSASHILPGGELSCEKIVKTKLSQLLGKEAVLLFSSTRYGEQALAKIPLRPSVDEETGAIIDIQGDALSIDDRHLFGLYGNQGMGVAAGNNSVELIFATFATLCGVSGSFIATSDRIAESILAEMPTCSERALTPAALGIIDSALDLVPAMEGERAELHQKVHFLNHQLQELGFKTRPSGHKIFIQFDVEEEAPFCWKRLYASGIYTHLVSPTHLSIALTHQHTSEHLHQFLGELSKVLLCLSPLAHSR